MDKTGMLTEIDTEDDVSMAPLTQQPHRGRRFGAAALVVFSTFALVLVFVAPGMLETPKENLSFSKDLDATVNFDATSEKAKVPSTEYPDPCTVFPHARLTNVNHSNLGEKGPDDGPEGIMYQALVYNGGISGQVQVQLNAQSEYKPAWVKENGYKDHFGVFNVKQGTNVSVKLGVYNITSGERIHIPNFVLTVFDLDQGKDNHSIEFITISNFKEVWLSNETEINQTDNDDGSSTFTATEEGNGEDNPTNPLALTPLQKNRAATFVFEDVDEIPFTFGASPGHTARVFMFAIRASMLCAYTKLPDGTLVNATDLEKSPVHVVTDDKSPAMRPHIGMRAISIALCFLWAAMQKFYS